MPGFILALYASNAHAHLVETGLGPVYDGIAHFVLSPEDLLPAFALAIFAGLRGKEYVRSVIFLLPAAWFIGGIAAILIGDPIFKVPAWLLLIAAGALVASDLRLSVVATGAIAIILGALLGVGNGSGLARAGSGLRELCGIAGAVFVLTTLVSAGAIILCREWMRIAWRVAGSWIAASGLLLLGWSLRR
jgi:hypothetical protein